MNKILFQSKAIFLHFGEGPRKIKVKKHAHTYTPKAAILSTCSAQQAGVRNYSSVELSFLYRAYLQKKKHETRNIVLLLKKSRRSTVTTKLAHDNSETSTLSNSDWLSTSLTSSTLHNCPSFSSLCSQTCSQRFHTNHNAVDLQVSRVDQRTAKKKRKKRQVTDITITSTINSCRGNQLQRSARFDTRYAEPPHALVTVCEVQTSGMHCACVHTKCRHTLRMGSHELESDARF